MSGAAAERQARDLLATMTAESIADLDLDPEILVPTRVGAWVHSKPLDDVDNPQVEQLTEAQP